MSTPKLPIYIKVEGVEVQIGTLEDGFGTPSAPLPKVLITDAMSEFQQNSIHKNKCTTNNEKTYFKNINTFLESKGVLYLSDINYFHIDEYKKILLSQVSPSTVNRQFNAYKSFFNYFSKTRRPRLLNDNPCSHIKAEKVRKEIRQTWTRRDFVLTLRKLDFATRDIMRFIRLTGARNHEAVDLVWSDIDFQSNNLIFRSKKSAGESSYFAITDSLSKLLHKRKINGLYVFGNGYKFTADSLGKKVKKAVIAAGLNEKLSPYGLRHTLCRDLLAAGISAPKTQKIMRHKSFKTTLEYAHWETNGSSHLVV